MKSLMSLIAVLMMTFALTGCAESVCDQLCDKVDECSGTSVADTCKSAYSQAGTSDDVCQTALDALDATCGGDDDDSAS